MPKTSSPAALFLTFFLGACTTVAVQSAASTAPDPGAASGETSASDPGSPGAGAEVASVLSMEAAPKATAPNGKGSIVHLARGRNAYLGRLRMDAGGAVPTHRDPTEEYIHILAGGGVMTIDGQTYEVGPGTTIYMPANAEVSYQNGDEEMVAIQVFAGPEPAAKYEAWTPSE